MNIEELAKKLITLAKKPILSKTEHVEAQNLMIELKKSGLSNLEIAKLSDGRWSVPTVKGYTDGIKAAEDSPWQDVVALLNSFISTGMSLETANTAVSVMEYLKSHQVSLIIILFMELSII